MIRSALPARPDARRLLIGTLFSSIGSGMTMPFLYVYLHEARHIDATLVGLASAWTGLASLIFAGPIGALIDRFGSRRVLVPLYLVGSVGTFSWSLVHAAWQAFLAATLVACAGATYAGMNTLLTSVTGADERHRVFSLNFALLNLGIGVGGILSGFIADVHHIGSFRVLYTVDAISWLIPGLVLLSLPSVGQRLASAHNVAESGGYREVLSDRPFRRLITFMFLLTGCGYAQFEIGMPAFATTVAHVSTHAIAWGLVANTLTIVAGQLLVTERLHGHSRSRALALAAAIVAVAWGVLGIGGFARHWLAGVAVTGVVLGPAIFGFAETIFNPLQPQITNALASDELRGRYNAFGTMTWSVTAIIGPITAAPLIGNGLGGVWLVLVVGGAVAAAAVALSLHRLLTPHQDGRASAEAMTTVLV